jgi:hypothetical protein
VDCAECGFSYQLVQPHAVPGRLRALRSGFSKELSGVGTVAHLMDVRRVLAAMA